MEVIIGMYISPPPFDSFAFILSHEAYLYQGILLWCSQEYEF